LTVLEQVVRDAAAAAKPEPLTGLKAFSPT
jgi:hypothetical protein